MPLTIIRRPRSAQRMTGQVRTEVRAALRTLADVARQMHEKDVESWKQKPRFITKVTVTNTEWQLTCKTDRRTKISKIYGWIDEGIGEYGGKTPLPDIKVKKAKALGFIVPHQPLSLPNPSVPGIPSSDAPHGVRTQSVRHPGIYPRNFSSTIRKWVGSTEPGAFRSVIEAAVKRAFRKIS